MFHLRLCWSFIFSPGKAEWVQHSHAYVSDRQYSWAEKGAQFFGLRLHARHSSLHVAHLMQPNISSFA
jgi:hypothetical protein